MSEGDKGFLGRWSQRKAALSQGKVLEEPTNGTLKPGVRGADNLNRAEMRVPDTSAAPAADTLPPTPPQLTLADAQQLTKDSDFKPFMAGEVTADVRNAAMKKLFADPQFNVMDGLDIYIDDYSVFEPIPESMLRQMVSAKFLNLFPDEEDKKDGVPPLTVSALDNAAAPNSGDRSDPALPGDIAPASALSADPAFPISHAITAAAKPDDHDHSHLRLQPNHAAVSPAIGRGTR